MKKPGLLTAACMLAACASPGVPPGGPADTEAPQIVRIVPDSGKTAITPRDVIFRFNEVVSERPSGAQSLGALFLISPRDGEPKVDWNREEVAVRPRRGWRRNTAYTVTLLPGMTDLRGNVRKDGAVTMFATGATIPASRISGTLFNWGEGRVITRGGLIEVRPRTDTTVVYVGTVDSAGVYEMGNLPADSYIVRGISDDNANRGLDRREAWDTVGVNLRDTASVNLYAFVHDSLGARVQSVAVRDSVTLDLSFDNPLSITQPVTAANIRILAPDSTAMQIASVSGPPPDTTVAARKLKRPIPARTVTVHLARPLLKATRYRIRVTDVRNLAGISRNSENLLTTPATFPVAAKPAAVPPPAAPPPAPPIRR